MKWSYNQNVPDEIRQAIEPLLPEVEAIIPAWYEIIYIHWDSEDNENVLRFRSDYAYRNGELWICPGFLSDCKPRLGVLIHEIAGHCVNGPLQRFCDETIDLLVDKDKDPILHKHLHAQVIERIEATSCDWEYGIQRLMESLKEKPFGESRNEILAAIRPTTEKAALLNKPKKR